MKGFVPRVGIGVISLVLVSNAPVGRAAGQQLDRQASDARAVLNRYCVGCHSEAQRQRGAVPIALDARRCGGSASGREGLGDGRPEDARRADAAGRPAASRSGRPRRLPRTGSKASSTARAELNPNPGRTEPFHRLNRDPVSERHPRSARPRDRRHRAAPVRRCQLRLRQHRRRVEDVADVDGAVSVGGAEDQPRGGRHARRPLPTVDYFRVADDLAQDRRLPGQSFGTRGGTKIRYTFPMDAQYVIRVQLSRDLERGRAGLYRGSAARGERGRRAREGVHAARRRGSGAGGGRRRRAAAGFRHARRRRRRPRPTPPAGPRRAVERAAGRPSREPRQHTGRPRRAEVESPGARAAESRRPRLGGSRPGQGRHARRRGRLHQPDLRAGRDRAAAVPASLSGRRQHRRDADRRLPAQRRDQRSPRSDGSGARRRAASGSSSAGPRRRSEEAGCARTILDDAGAPRLPSAGRPTPTSIRCWRSTRGPQGRRVRRRHRVGAEASARRVPSSCFASKSIRRTRGRTRRIASAIWNWRRACRSSCGAAFRTRNC